MNNASLFPVILCGGSGTRLWPLSRSQHPKQFLKLLSERSLFLETVLRGAALPGSRPPFIIGNEAHRFLIADELAKIGMAPTELLLEPVARNTAPALAVAAIRAERHAPTALLLAMPADHHISDGARFAEAIRHGLHAARAGALVTFGVPPTCPHTGYGYIRKGPGAGNPGTFQVDEFREKPDAETAAAYLASGEYLWNSGMFLMRADIYLRELARHAPDIALAAGAAAERVEHDGAFLHLDARAFGICRSESIDYAVMEHTTSAAVVELDAGWSDLGSWPNLRDAAKLSAKENYTHGDVFLDDVSGSVVHSTGRLVAALGLHNHVVVETPDAVFVAPIERAPEVKQMVAALQKCGRQEAENHLRTYRPWGWYESLARGERMQVKRILVNPGASLSLQLHHRRTEHWVVVRGEAQVIRSEETFVLHENESAYIPVETRHRLSNQGKQPLEIIEVQSGSYLGEDDIVRFDDIYGRAGSPARLQIPLKRH